MKLRLIMFFVFAMLVANASAVSINNSDTQLEVWNNGPKAIGEQVRFFANYTNLTSGEVIPQANCTIYFYYFNETYNMTNGTVWEYNRSFNLSDTYDYDVFCDELNISHSVTILHLHVTLNSPADENLSVYENIIFNFTGIDSDGIKSATLYGNFSGNWSSSESNMSFQDVGLIEINLSEGTYLWNVYICDNLDLCNFSEENRTLTIRFSAPIIDLNSPSDGGSLTSGDSVIFSYDVRDDYGIESCSLYIDNEKVEERSSLIGENSFTQSLSEEGSYEWFVSCINSKMISHNSTLYDFSIDYSDDSDSSSDGNPTSSQSSTTSSGSSSSNSQSIVINNSNNSRGLTENDTATNQSENASFGEPEIEGEVPKSKEFKTREIGLIATSFFIAGGLGIFVYKKRLKRRKSEEEESFEPKIKKDSARDSEVLPEDSWEPEFDEEN